MPGSQRLLLKRGNLDANAAHPERTGDRECGWMTVVVDRHDGLGRLSAADVMGTYLGSAMFSKEQASYFHSDISVIIKRQLMQSQMGTNWRQRRLSS
jgi:hypothetical protein